MDSKIERSDSEGMVVNIVNQSQSTTSGLVMKKNLNFLGQNIFKFFKIKFTC